jgi:hypothetical protein
MNDDIPKKKGARVALTKTEAEEGFGLELIELSRTWLADGKFDIHELDELKAWLAKVPDDGIPAIRFLKEEVQRYFDDGEIYSWKLSRLQASLIRVIPPKDREEAKCARSEAARIEWEKRAPERDAARRASVEQFREARERHADEWAEEPATEAQLEYIRDLGGSLTESASKLEASEKIDQLLGRKAEPSSSRGNFGCAWVVAFGVIVAAGVASLV